MGLYPFLLPVFCFPALDAPLNQWVISEFETTKLIVLKLVELAALLCSLCFLLCCISNPNNVRLILQCVLWARKSEVVGDLLLEYLQNDWGHWKAVLKCLLYLCCPDDCGKAYCRGMGCWVSSRLPGIAEITCFLVLVPGFKWTCSPDRFHFSEMPESYPAAYAVYSMVLNVIFSLRIKAKKPFILLSCCA